MDRTSNPCIFVERTLAVIKPDAVHKAEEIEDQILKLGFKILQKRKLQLSPEQCSEFYEDQYAELFFSSLIAFMTSGPIIAMTLARNNAVSYWKVVMGPSNSTKARETDPDSLRAIYGTSDLKNALHGSESYKAAMREIKFMFPNSIIEYFPAKETTEEFLSKCINPTLLHGLTEVCKHKPHNPTIWLADWLLKHNPNKPQVREETVVEEAE